MRFENDCIYTYTGPILLAVNPFQRLPLYTKDVRKVRRSYIKDSRFLSCWNNTIVLVCFDLKGWMIWLPCHRMCTPLRMQRIAA